MLEYLLDLDLKSEMDCWELSTAGSVWVIELNRKGFSGKLSFDRIRDKQLIDALIFFFLDLHYLL